jgi:hypothetical protein
MMGRGAFILLKAGRLWPKNAEQAKIQLAILLKILPIDDSEGRKPSPRTEDIRWFVFTAISAGYG